MNACRHWEEVRAEETCGPDGKTSDAVRRWAFHPDRLIRRNRRQAIETFPIIATLLATDADIPNPNQVQAAIDCGTPLIEVLASIFGIRKATVRGLRGVAPALPGATWFERPCELFAALDALSPEKMPRSASDWQRFGELRTGCEQLAEDEALLPSYRTCPPDPVAWTIFLGLCAAGYERSAKRLRSDLGDGPEAWLRMKEYFRFVTTWIESGAGFCEMNHQLRTLARVRLREEFLARYSAIELIRQSVRWHREMERVRKAETGSDLPPRLHGWPALPGLPLQVNDLMVVSLTSAFELKEESLRLDHCAGMYFEVCVLGCSHILSIRTPDGRSLSTAEISLGRDDRGRVIPEVIQHQAIGNSPPGPGCVQALEDVLKVLGAPERQAELEDLEQFHFERFDRIEAMLQHARGDYPAHFMTGTMHKVLRDADRALDWLDRRLAEEEGWYRHQNEQAGERFERLGLDGELTWERATEAYLTTGNAEILHEGISLFRERHWSDNLAGGPDRYGRVRFQWPNSPSGKAVSPSTE